MGVLGTRVSIWKEFKKKRTLEGITLILRSNKLCSRVKKTEDALYEVARKRNRVVESVAQACLKRMALESEEKENSSAEDAGEKAVSSNVAALVVSAYEEYRTNEGFEDATEIQAKLLLGYIFATEEYNVDLRGRRNVAKAFEPSTKGVQKVRRFVECMVNRMRVKMERLAYMDRTKRELVEHLKELGRFLTAHQEFFFRVFRLEYSEAISAVQSMCDRVESEVQEEGFGKRGHEKFIYYYARQIEEWLDAKETEEDCSILCVFDNPDFQGLFGYLLEREKVLAKEIDAEKHSILKREAVKNILYIQLSRLSFLQKGNLSTITHTLAKLQCIERIKHALLRLSTFVTVIEAFHLRECSVSLGKGAVEYRKEVSIAALALSLISTLFLFVLRMYENQDAHMDRFFRDLGKTAGLLLVNYFLGFLFYLCTHNTSSSAVLLSLIVLWWMHIAEYTFTFKTRFSYLSNNTSDTRDNALQHSRWFVLVVFISLIVLFAATQEVYLWTSFSWFRGA